MHILEKLLPNSDNIIIRKIPEFLKPFAKWNFMENGNIWNHRGHRGTLCVPQKQRRRERLGAENRLVDEG